MTTKKQEAIRQTGTGTGTSSVGSFILSPTPSRHGLLTSESSQNIAALHKLSVRQQPSLSGPGNLYLTQTPAFAYSGLISTSPPRGLQVPLDSHSSSGACFPQRARPDDGRRTPGSKAKTPMSLAPHLEPSYQFVEQAWRQPLQELEERSSVATTSGTNFSSPPFGMDTTSPSIHTPLRITTVPEVFMPDGAPSHRQTLVSTANGDNDSGEFSSRQKAKTDILDPYLSQGSGYAPAPAYTESTSSIDPRSTILDCNTEDPLPSSPYDQLQQFWQNSQQQYNSLQSSSNGNGAGTSRQPQLNNSNPGLPRDQQPFAASYSGIPYGNTINPPSTASSLSAQCSPTSPMFTFMNIPARQLSYPFQNANDDALPTYLPSEAGQGSNFESFSSLSRPGTGYMESYSNPEQVLNRSHSSHPATSHDSSRSSFHHQEQQVQQYPPAPSTASSDQWNDIANYPQTYPTEQGIHPVSYSSAIQYVDGMYGNARSFSSDNSFGTHSLQSQMPSAGSATGVASSHIQPLATSWSNALPSTNVHFSGNDGIGQGAFPESRHTEPSTLSLSADIATSHPRCQSPTSFSQLQQQHQLNHRASSPSIATHTSPRSTGSDAQNVSLQSPSFIGIEEKPSTNHDRRSSESDVATGCAVQRYGKEYFASPAASDASARHSRLSSYSEGWPAASVGYAGGEDTFDYAFTNPPLHFDYSKPGAPRLVSSLTACTSENPTRHRHRHSLSSVGAHTRDGRGQKNTDSKTQEEPVSSNVSDFGASASDGSTGSSYFSKGQKRSRPVSSPRTNKPAIATGNDPSGSASSATAPEVSAMSSAEPRNEPTVGPAYGESGLLLQNYYDALPPLSQLQLGGEMAMQKRPQPFHLKNPGDVTKNLDTNPERSSQDLPAASRKESEDESGQNEETAASHDDTVISESTLGRHVLTGRKIYECNKCSRSMSFNLSSRTSF